MQEACSGCDSRHSYRRTGRVDEVRLGLRRLAHQPRDAGTLYEVPETAGRRTPSEPLRPTQEMELETQARAPAGAANAVRLALRRPTHGQPDAGAFHELRAAAVGSNSARGVPPRGQKVRGTSDIASVQRIEAMPRGTRNRSPTPNRPHAIPLGGLRRLILGHASARDLRGWAGNSASYGLGATIKLRGEAARIHGRRLHLLRRSVL